MKALFPQLVAAAVERAVVDRQAFVDEVLALVPVEEYTVDV